MDGVDLPVTPPVAPLLVQATAMDTVPAEVGVWSYQAEWDGFFTLFSSIVRRQRRGQAVDSGVHARGPFRPS